MTLLSYVTTPVQEIFNPVLDNAGVQLLIKREELNHPTVSGNKWWKLKYNLAEAKKQGKQTLLTFGGAYANHIYATAAAAYELQMESIGMIRGEETLPLNPTLHFATTHGMKLEYLSRTTYRTKTSDAFLQQLTDRFSDTIYVIPEGGSNSLAVKGICEFASLLPIHANYICCAVGTGGTLAGLISGLPDSKKVIGFSSLKGEGSLVSEIKSLLTKKEKYPTWEINNQFHFGGYGKYTPALLSFIQNFKINHGIELDFVYTAKMIAGIFNLVEKKFFPRGSTLLAIHTGGLQGNESIG